MTAAGTGNPAELAGVPCVRADLSRNANIGQLASMMRDASSMTDPAKLLRHFGPWLSRRAPRDALVSVSRRNMPEPTYKFTRVLVHPVGRDGNPIDAPIQDPWREWGRLDTHSGGFVWELIKTPEPKLFNSVDLTKDPALSRVMGDRAAELGAVAAFPAYDAGEALNWALVFFEPGEWTDLEMFENGFLDLNMIGTATRNLVSRRTVEDLNARLEDQFEQVGAVQRALIPDANPELEGYTLATSYLPSAQAGGDMYDYFAFPDGRLGVMIADVAGHGAAAATVMAMIAAAIRSYTIQNEENDKGTNPAAVAGFVNAVLLTSPLPNIFVTAFFCVLDPKTGTIEWVRCGHNPPRIRGNDGTLRTLDQPSTLPLGIMENLNVPALTSTLEPGESLVLYTDGITEARAPDGEMFGETRLDDALLASDPGPKSMIGTLNERLAAFTRSEARDDDQTLLVVRHDP